MGFKHYANYSGINSKNVFNISSEKPMTINIHPPYSFSEMLVHG